MDTSKPLYPFHIVEATPSEIASLTTRHIHAMFKCWRGVAFRAAYVKGNYDEDPDKYELLYIRATEILRAELARRPHVPNKAEGKALRRAAAKRGR